MRLSVISRMPKRASVVLVLGATDDTIIFPGMAHDMMLEDGWQPVANTIADWLEPRES
jgi:alpha-beta hydrolase superfamily lysophospholipase